MDSTLEDSMDVTMEQGDGSNANAPDSEPASASGVNKSRQQVKLFEYKTTRRNNRRVFSSKRLQKFLTPVLNALVRHEHSGPFLQPVDVEALGLYNYNDIIKNPMDLSTIRNKLESGVYKEPWEFIDDVWLMLENAKRYNRKGSNVYRGAELLGKMFEENVDVVMQSMGYCCGKRLFYTPPTLFCVAKRVCIIPRDTTYYSYGEYVYCKKCFSTISGDQVPLHNERNEVTGCVLKDQFQLVRNDHLDPEPFVQCKNCGREIHQICAMYLDSFWPRGFYCDNCQHSSLQYSISTELSPENLPKTYLSDYIENRVNNYLTKSGAAGVGVKVSIRAVSIRDRIAEMKPLMKARNPDCDGLPYRAKAIFAFLQLEGHEVVFFGMHVQEYGSDCPSPNSRRVYIGYLDSVQYFRPRELRTSVYREILLGYLKYIKNRGFLTAHIWACPPGNDDDYIFHCHPPEQKIPQPGRLQEWYKNILRKGQEEGTVIEFKNLYRYVTEEHLNPVDDLPYFEGDFWPMILEDSLKDMDKEEEKKKEADATLNHSNGSNSGGHDARLKKKPKKTFKRLSHHMAKDLPTKMQNVIKRHQESFLVVVINTPETLLTLKMSETEDADFLVYSDLMDGRDGLLSVAMERHYEFSSYRRAMFSTMLVLYALTHPDREKVFMCTHCSVHFTKGFRCPECVSLYVCDSCQEIVEKHTHDMTPIVTDTGSKPVEHETRLQYQTTLVDGLIHAVKCSDDSCKRVPCPDFRRFKEHVQSCMRQNLGKCENCRQMAQLLKAHAKFCTKVKCPVLHCHKFKMEFRKLRVTTFQTNRVLQRRKRMMLQQQLSAEPEADGADTKSATTVDHEGPTTMEVD